jgi:hypothetical protein
MEGQERFAGRLPVGLQLPLPPRGGPWHGRPVHLWARRMASAGYLAGLTLPCLVDLRRVSDHGDVGWFWIVLNLVAAALLALVVVRVVRMGYPLGVPT